jgi:drug/metabolite transporter (DMT)-like permease
MWGVAATLMAVVPILVIPQQYILHGDRRACPEIVGAVITVAGIAVVVTAL